MPASQWTTDIIVICVLLAIATAVIGFVIATLRQSRQVSQLSLQLDQAQQAKASAETQQHTLQSQLREAEARSHALQVEEGKLKAQLQASGDNADRLSVELQERKTVGADLQVKLEEANRQHHEAAKRLEAVQADARGLQEQVTELRERLDTSATTNATLQEERDRLKDALASEETRAKVAETTEREAREQLSERLSKLGGTLNTASNHYNSTVKALAGQQGLYGKVERFNKLSAKVSKTLPALEPAHMDFESERLSLIVEALDDSPEPSENLPQLPVDDHEGAQQTLTETNTENEFEFF